MLVNKLQVKFSDLALGHSEDAARSVRYAPKLSHFEIDCPSLGNLVNR